MMLQIKSQHKIKNNSSKNSLAVFKISILQVKVVVEVIMMVTIKLLD
jgi:hypothetical protein